MYFYQAFGIAIESELRCPELLEIEPRVAELKIRSGRVSSLDANQVQNGAGFYAAAGELKMEIEGVARFLAKGGVSIVFERAGGATDDEVRLYLLGSVLGAILMQRGLLVLHGSSVIISGKAVAFLGESGVGKSTLSAALRQRGFPLLSDDLFVVGGSGELKAFSGYPQNKLWPDSLAVLDLEIEGLRKIRPQLEKRALLIEGTQFATRSYPVGRIYLLAKGQGDSLKFSQLSGGQKMAELLACRYRPEFVSGLEVAERQFKQLGEVAKSVRVDLILRPCEGFVLDGLVARILEDGGLFTGD